MPQIYVPGEGQKRLDEFLVQNEKYLKAHRDSIKYTCHIDIPKVGAGGYWKEISQEEFDEIWATTIVASELTPFLKEYEKYRNILWRMEDDKRKARFRTVRQTILEAMEEVRIHNLPKPVIKLSLFQRFLGLFKKK